jgi:hypothetical protein
MLVTLVILTPIVTRVTRYSSVQIAQRFNNLIRLITDKNRCHLLAFSVCRGLKLCVVKLH